MRWWLAILMVTGCRKEPPPPPGATGCLSCHVGIEDILPEQALVGLGDHEPCTFCHGGDPEASTKEDAHVPIPANFWEVRGDDLPPAPDGYIKDMAPDQLDALDPAWVKFVNPGDIRVADQTCGPCHPDHVAHQRNSIMTTNAGHYMPTRFLAGFQDRSAVYGSYAATDPDCTGAEGTACALEPLVPDSDAAIEAALAAGDEAALEEIAYNHYLAKSCDTCHQAGYGKNNSPHLYRSTGCSSCHMLYDPSGVYRGADEAIPKNLPTWPAVHTLTRAIPTQQCATCHFQGGRIGLNFRGIRESGFKDVPPHAEPWNETAYGHTAGYYLFDEDTTNDVDETPPDLHYAAGMHCADCHVGSDVHGDGRLYTTAKYQVDIGCEDCHGTISQGREPDAAGLYYTRTGRVLPQLSTAADGGVVLTSIVGETEHPVTQIVDLQGDPAVAAAHGDGDGSHTDALTCDTCHNSWNLYCLGCHVSMDMRLDQVDHQTGTASTGLVRGSRDVYMLDHTLLGTGFDGRVQTVIPSQQVQMAAIDPQGNVVVGDETPDGIIGKFRTTALSEANIGFAPFFQHTTSRASRSCDTCHRTDDSPGEWARVMGVYGYGTGEFVLDNARGAPVDVLRFLDEDGGHLTEWVHLGTGPVRPEVRERALDVVLPP